MSGNILAALLVIKIVTDVFFKDPCRRGGSCHKFVHWLPLPGQSVSPPKDAFQHAEDEASHEKSVVYVWRVKCCKRWITTSARVSGENEDSIKNAKEYSRLCCVCRLEKARRPKKESKDVGT